MTLPRSVADVLSRHVRFEIESIDRMYLNVYQPRLQYPKGAAAFFHFHRGHTFASSALMAPMTKMFVAAIHDFIDAHGLDLVAFVKGQRKDDVMHEYLVRHDGSEGVLFVGRAQEKATVMRTERRYDARTGASYAWLVKATALVNHFYFYCYDDDFGPFFIKFCSYFPYNAKLCINGHEWAKRQAAKKGSGSPRWTTGSPPSTTRPRFRRSATGSARSTSTRCCANGYVGYHTPSPGWTTPPATGTRSPCCRPSSP